jgi:hypothetical protein
MLAEHHLLRLRQPGGLGNLVLAATTRGSSPIAALRSQPRATLSSVSPTNSLSGVGTTVRAIGCLLNEITHSTSVLSFVAPNWDLSQRFQLVQGYSTIWLVLPDRIELSTSPFITPMLSHPHAAFVCWTIPSP